MRVSFCDIVTNSCVRVFTCVPKLPHTASDYYTLPKNYYTLPRFRAAFRPGGSRTYACLSATSSRKAAFACSPACVFPVSNAPSVCAVRQLLTADRRFVGPYKRVSVCDIVTNSCVCVLTCVCFASAADKVRVLTGQQSVSCVCVASVSSGRTSACPFATSSRTIASVCSPVCALSQLLT